MEHLALCSLHHGTEQSRTLRKPTSSPFTARTKNLLINYDNENYTLASVIFMARISRTQSRVPPTLSGVIIISRFLSCFQKSREENTAHMTRHKHTSYCFKNIAEQTKQVREDGGGDKRRRAQQRERATGQPSIEPAYNMPLDFKL